MLPWYSLCGWRDIKISNQFASWNVFCWNFHQFFTGWKISFHPKAVPKRRKRRGRGVLETVSENPCHVSLCLIEPASRKSECSCWSGGWHCIGMYDSVYRHGETAAPATFPPSVRLTSRVSAEECWQTSKPTEAANLFLGVKHLVAQKILRKQSIQFDRIMGDFHKQSLCYCGGTWNTLVILPKVQVAG